MFLADLVSDIKPVIDRGPLYRFVQSAVVGRSEDRLSACLMTAPAAMTRPDIVRRIAGGKNAGEVAETFWTVITRDGAHSDTLRHTQTHSDRTRPCPE